MIKWVGKDATKRMCWTASADNYNDLYHILVEKGIINYDEISPYQMKQLRKAGLSAEDFQDPQALNDALSELPALSEEEIRLLIYHTDDVARYQEFNEAEVL